MNNIVPFITATTALVTGETGHRGGVGRAVAEGGAELAQRPLRIAMPIHSFDPGGVERVGLNLSASWDSSGHRITVVLGRDTGEGRGHAPRLHYWRRDCSVSTASFETIWMISALYRYLKNHEVDVLFLPGNTYAVVGAAMRMLLGSACPPIAIKISNDLERRDMSPAMRAGYGLWLKLQGALFDRFVAMAVPMLAEIREKTDADGERVKVVADPALTRERFECLSALPRRPIAPWKTHYIGVGRLVSQKNFALLIRAFASQAGAGDTLTIAGDGPERTALERLAHDLGVGDRVSLPGHLTSTDELLSEADVFVMSSDYEGLPAVLIEAMAAGLPIVTTDCSAAITYLLDGGRQGILVGVGDGAELAAALRAVRSFAFEPARSRETAARFTVENAADAYVAILAELASGSRLKLGEAIAKYRYFGVTGG